MIRFGELAPDVANLNTGVASVANNVLPGANAYQPFYDFSSVATALTGECKGAVTMKDNAGNNYIYAGDATTLYGIESGTPTDYSKVSGYTDNSEKWSFINWGDSVIASKFGDTPQIMTLGSTAFADLGGSPPQGRTITTIRNFVVFGNTWDSTDENVTNRVRWSGYEDEAGWTAGTNQSDWQDIEGRGGEIKRIVGGEYGIVFQERSIWRMSYVGTPLVFQFDEVEPGRGTPAGGSVVQHGADIYYLGQDGFYVLRNGSTSEPIGYNKIDLWFYENLNEASFDNITSAIDPEKGLIYWAYPSSNSSDGSNDSVIAYNYKTGWWSTATIDIQEFFQGANSAYTLEGLDAFGDIDSINVSLDSHVWQGGAYKLGAFNNLNQFGFLTGNALAGTIETGEIFTDGAMTQLSEVRPVIDGASTIVLSTRDRLTDSPTDSSSLSPDTSGKVNVRTHARYHRIKITTSGDFSNAIGVEVKTKNRGTR